MGYAERSYSYRFGNPSGGGGGGLGRLFGSVTPWVRRLLIANGAIWLLMWAGLLPGEWAIRTFGSSPEGFLTRPWSPLTYMFVHGGFWHVLVNMFVLFFFGPPLERTWGGREFLKYYLVAGLGGALGSLAFLPLPEVQADTLVVGASGAIFGLMLAFALLWPDAKIYIWGILPMRAKWFVALLAGFTLYASFTAGGDNVAHWAHLGGLVTGFGYLKWGQGISRALDPIFDRVAALWPGDGSGSTLRERTTGGGSGRTATGRRRRRTDAGKGDGARESKEGSPRGRVRRFRPEDDDGEPTSEEMLDEVDRILDKIREDGLDSLSEEGREFLDERSRRYRG
jgi:membrane associated rhomboid family serine protease